MELPLARQKTRRIWELTVDLVYTGVNDVGLAVESHVTNAKALPVSKQTNEVTANFAATDMEAESFAGGLDV